MKALGLDLGTTSNSAVVLETDSGVLAAKTVQNAAIVSDGELVGNSRYFTGEVGHTIIRFDGRRQEISVKALFSSTDSIRIYPSSQARMSARSLPPTLSSTSFSVYNHRRSTFDCTAAMFSFVLFYLLKKA